MLTKEIFSTNINLRTITHIVSEGICLFIIFITSILLTSPLVSKINKLLVNHKKSTKIEPIVESSSTTNYPILKTLSSLSAVINTVYQSPVNKSSEESISNNNNNNNNNNENCISDIRGEIIDENIVSIVKNSNSKISYDCKLVNYNSYRHKLIEETLRKQYGGDYAPGNVILNLIQLNTVDSKSSVILSKKYDRSFFDDIKIEENGILINFTNSNEEAGEYRLEEIEFPNQLSHFIPRNLIKPSTTETQTETANQSEISITLKPSIVPSARPNTPTSCQRINSIRFRESNYPTKSPFTTPVNSQSPLAVNSILRTQKSREKKLYADGESVNLVKNLTPLTEQLYRRNDTRPYVVSKTHVEAEEYLNRITKNKSKEEEEEGTIAVDERRIKTSLKKSGRHTKRDVKKFLSKNNEKTGDCDNQRRSNRNDIKRLATSKPTIWNN